MNFSKTEMENVNITLKPLGHYDLAKTLECGQCFRWERADGGKYVGVAYGRAIAVEQNGENIIIYNSTEDDVKNIWTHYFAISEDYDAINNDILKNCTNPTLARAVKQGNGIRILHQEPWETTCSFIISQNNNIPRIKKIISALSRSLGERIDSPMGELYSFPTPERILAAGEEHIRSLGTGFRARYIMDAAEKWCDGTLGISEIKNIERLDDAIDYLCKVKGIGLKVASCSLLFGFERYDPFPVDVWMKRVIEKYFDKDFTPETIGKYAGVAQQYLFDYERSIGNE